MTLPHLRNTPSSEADWFQALIDLARYLRSPEGCPWDRQQSALKFAEFARGEVDELVASFEIGDHNVAEELGDSLFILLSSAAAAESEGRLKLEEVLRAAHEKMVRRHDHVFGEVKAATPEEAIAAWNRAKAREKNHGKV